MLQNFVLLLIKQLVIGKRSDMICPLIVSVNSVSITEFQVTISSISQSLIKLNRITPHKVVTNYSLYQENILRLLYHISWNFQAKSTNKIDFFEFYEVLFVSVKQKIEYKSSSKSSKL